LKALGQGRHISHLPHFQRACALRYVTPVSCPCSETPWELSNKAAFKTSQGNEKLCKIPKEAEGITCFLKMK